MRAVCKRCGRDGVVQELHNSIRHRGVVVCADQEA
jgi:hypothetical protein